MKEQSAIRLALQPHLEQLKIRGTETAQKHIDKALQELEEKGWDLNAVAPYPDAFNGCVDYHGELARHKLFVSLTESTSYVRARKSPDIRNRSPKKESKFIAEYIADLENQFEAYILKMENKIGEVKSAKLYGEALWGYSILEVENEQGVEKWKTQMIINVSKLGKLFNQFPTRKMKK